MGRRGVRLTPIGHVRGPEYGGGKVRVAGITARGCTAIRVQGTWFDTRCCEQGQWMPSVSPGSPANFPRGEARVRSDLPDSDAKRHDLELWPVSFRCLNYM